MKKIYNFLKNLILVCYEKGIGQNMFMIKLGYIFFFDGVNDFIVIDLLWVGFYLLKYFI